MSKCPIAPLFGRSGALVSTGLVRKREPPRRTLRPRVRRGYLRKRCLVFVFGRKRGFGGRKVNRVVPVSTVRGIFRGGKRKVARRPVSFGKGIVRRKPPCLCRGCSSRKIFSFLIPNAILIAISLWRTWIFIWAKRTYWNLLNT